MPDSQAVLFELERLDIPVTGKVVRDTAGSGRFFVFVPVIRNSENRQVPSNKNLEAAKESLATMGIEVEFILTDGHQRDAEAGIRATLLHSFGDVLRNTYLSSSGDTADVWLEPKYNLEPDMLQEIREKAELFLSDVGLRAGDVVTTSGQNLPGKTALLKTIRRLSPVLTQDLKKDLLSRDFEVPSTDWLNRRLDGLRKTGFVVRLQNGRYALTLFSLRALGTAKNAGSPDISRLLALAATKK